MRPPIGWRGQETSSAPGGGAGEEETLEVRAVSPGGTAPGILQGNGMSALWFLPPTPHSKSHPTQGSPLGGSPRYRSEQEKGKPGLRGPHLSFPAFQVQYTDLEGQTHQPDILLIHRFQLWSLHFQPARGRY